jgi:PadR family transcriptional regulator, regulatory protein AphA
MSSTPFAILGLLSIEPMSGYDIRRNLDESLSHFWSESYGQIYPSLKRLEATGLIAPVKQAASGSRRKRLFTLTSKGRATLRSWLAEAPKPQPPRNELMLKIFFGRLAPPGAVAAHIRRLQVQQEQLLATLEAIERQLGAERAGHPDLPYWLLTLKAGVERGKALLDWSDDALATLKGTP